MSGNVRTHHSVIFLGIVMSMRIFGPVHEDSALLALGVVSYVFILPALVVSGLVLSSMALILADQKKIGIGGLLANITFGLILAGILTQKI